jgi:C-terminal processing protease CtpA/Prc
MKKNISQKNIFHEKKSIISNTMFVTAGKYPDPGIQEASRRENLPSFTEFRDKIFKTIQLQDIHKLIFDIRLNSGGNSIQGSGLIKELAVVEKLKPKGKLYVVIGRKTYSSAVINAIDFLENTSAIFAGEETGGKPNHFGEVRTFQLPDSKSQVNYSTKYFKKTEKDIPALPPDVVIEEGFENFKAGIDPVFVWISNAF